MQSLTHDQIPTMLFAIALLLGAARLLGEIAQRLRQPAVLGEILAGILLGPTVFGTLLPEVQAAIFPREGPVSVALQGLTTLSVTLFLMAAGMELDLSAVWRQGRTALAVGASGIIVPFALGFAAAWLLPEQLGAAPGSQQLLFALILATAMSITALPVIAKILIDLNLLRSEVGVTIIAAAIMNDLAGWLIFSMVLALVVGHAGALPVGVTILLMVLFTAFTLTIGRWLIDRWLPWIQANTGWPGGVLGFGLTLTLLCAAFAEAIGVHAVFGALIFGVALGDSAHLRQRTRATINHFVSFFFAPLFFASIGLRVDFVRNFDLLLVVLISVLATLGKLAGCTFAARKAGFPPREAWAVGFGMNARGAMEIILGVLALEAGLIDERLFVALVVMALVTSLAAGLLIQRALGPRRTAQFVDFVSARTFVATLTATERRAAIQQLAGLAAEAAGVDQARAVQAVLAREQLITSALGNGVAVPHARIIGLKQPAVAVGISRAGIDFDAPDGAAVRVIILVLTPADDPNIHLDILADIAGVFRDDRLGAKLAARVSSLTELRAFLNIETRRDGPD